MLVSALRGGAPRVIADAAKLRTMRPRVKERCLYAFDLLHLRETDLRPVELVGRRGMLKKLLRKAGSVLIFSENMDGADGECIFRHACALGLKGIVSKRLDKPYSSGRC